MWTLTNPGRSSRVRFRPFCLIPTSGVLHSPPVLNQCEDPIIIAGVPFTDNASLTVKDCSIVYQRVGYFCLPTRTVR